MNAVGFVLYSLTTGTGVRRGSWLVARGIGHLIDVAIHIHCIDLWVRGRIPFEFGSAQGLHRKRLRVLML